MLDNLIQLDMQPQIKPKHDKATTTKEVSNDGEDFSKYMQEATSDVTSCKKDIKSEKSDKKEKQPLSTNEKKEEKHIKKDDKKIQLSNDEILRGELNPNEIFGTLFHVLKIAKELGLDPNLSAPIRELKTAKTVKDIVDIAKKYNLNITKIEFSKEEQELNIKDVAKNTKTAAKIGKIVETIEQKIKQDISQKHNVTTNAFNFETKNNNNKSEIKVSLADILKNIQDKDKAIHQKEDNAFLNKNTNINKIFDKDKTNEKNIKNLNIGEPKKEEDKTHVFSKTPVVDLNQDDKLSNDVDTKVDFIKEPLKVLLGDDEKDIKANENIGDEIDNFSSFDGLDIQEKPILDEKLSKEEPLTFDNFSEDILESLSANSVVDEKIFLDKKDDELVLVSGYDKANIDGEKLLGSLLKGLKTDGKQDVKIGSIDEFQKTIQEVKTKDFKPTLEQFFSEKYQPSKSSVKIVQQQVDFLGGDVKVDIGSGSSVVREFATKTLPSFASDLAEVVDKFKPPVSRVKITLNPKELGEVEVTVSVRGKNLNIQLNSQNQNTMNLFVANQNELRYILLEMGFGGLDMNFSHKKEDDNKKHQHKNKKEDDNNEDITEEVMLENINIEVPLSSFELKV